MTDTLKPRDGKDVEDAVRGALAEAKSLEIVGHGSKRAIGRPAQTEPGYDLSKLMAGSWGTLAAMTEVTIKVLPRPETEATVILSGLDDAKAVAAMTAAMGTSCEVSGAAHLPAVVLSRIPLGEPVAAGRALTA